MTVAPQPTPAEQVKGLRWVSRTLLMSGLLIGIGMPTLFSLMQIRTMPTPWGFDITWPICLFVMIADFVLAWRISRRASSIERALPPA